MCCCRPTSDDFSRRKVVVVNLQFSWKVSAHFALFSSHEQHTKLVIFSSNLNHSSFLKSLGKDAIDFYYPLKPTLDPLFYNCCFDLYFIRMRRNTILYLLLIIWKHNCILYYTIDLSFRSIYIIIPFIHHLETLLPSQMETYTFHQRPKSLLHDPKS